ncbi:helix-turn-helix transcriptional regulator [Chitinophaga japonensis]|uniref:Helix-turn-helix protein n=1 Tax=Chitinophaga japonensis TaxID=104662 RepID=A0A562T3H3_CHIJA|nr:helix-turn-helix transcriptional regulator [Chitinophaga japonensis]TWI87943.1 helix-turn-helix protein [Chitinophaga japonensis]
MANQLRYNRIKATLALKGKTQNELAAHLKMSIYTVSKWCTNKTQPAIPDLYEIAKFLDVNVCELLEPNPS